MHDKYKAALNIATLYHSHKRKILWLIGSSEILSIIDLVGITSPLPTQ